MRSWPSALSAYAAAVAVFGYRAMLTHLLLLSVNHQRTPSRRVAARVMILLCYAAVLLPVPADGFLTIGTPSASTAAAATAGGARDASDAARTLALMAGECQRLR